MNPDEDTVLSDGFLLSFAAVNTPYASGKMALGKSARDTRLGRTKSLLTMRK
jgi:hypothetical protein